eukprot:6781185-Pyramimonas_sp.AAC.1
MRALRGATRALRGALLMTAYSFHLRAVLLEIDGERGPAAEASITVAAQRPARPSTSGVFIGVCRSLSVFIGAEKSKTGLQSRD